MFPVLHDEQGSGESSGLARVRAALESFVLHQFGVATITKKIHTAYTQHTNWFALVSTEIF